MTSQICCDNSSSWVCIGIYKPRGRLTFSGRTADELASRISSISHAFNTTSPGLSIKTAVLKSNSSNQVAVFSVWDKGSVLEEPCKRPKVLSRKLLDSVHDTVLRGRKKRGSYSLVPPLAHVDAFEKALSAAAHLVDVSWYEVLCSDSKERVPLSPLLRSTPGSQGNQQQARDPQPPSPLVPAFSSTLSPTLSYPPSCWESSRSTPSPMLSSLSSPSLTRDLDEHIALSASPASSSSLSMLSQHLSLGDVVHLRCIVSNKPYLEDVLSYSCLAILKAYFPQTDGLLSYSFYRSLNGSRMAAMGLWQNYDAASTFLHAPDGAREERYWRCLGAKTTLGVYEVVALVTG